MSPSDAPASLRSIPDSTIGSATDFPLRVFFGHHKCATGFIDRILREICWHMGLAFHIVHRPVHFAEEGSLPAYVQTHSTDFLAYTNADARHAAGLSFHRAFHVVRDPRDVLVSAYFSHLHSHSTEGWPELAAHREALQRVPKDEGLFLEMEFSRPVFEEMVRWDYTQPNVLELHMEALTQDPAGTFVEIVRFLDMLDDAPASGPPAWVRTATMRLNRLNQTGRRFMPGGLRPFPVPRRRMHTLSTAEVNAMVDACRFEKITGGRKKGQENVKSHYRKGVPGDWKNHFSPDHVAAFKREYNDVLLKLGYAETPHW